MATADEGSFIELLVANERVLGWLDELGRLGAGSRRLHPLLKEMADAVTDRPAYAEEARKAGAVPLLTSLMKRCTNGDCLDLISAVISVCSGPMASGGGLRTLRYAGVPVTVKEGALGDGVGAKVWTVAHTLCQEMVTHPEIVAGRAVVEIGAGCGPCGLLAAKLGAQEVAITDYVDQLLLNLRDALHANGLGAEGGGGGGGSEGEREASAEGELAAALDENWDPEEDGGSECSDLDAFLAGGAEETDGSGAERGGGGGGGAAWEAGPVAVRFLDWADSVAHLDGARGGDGAGGAAPRAASYCALDGASSGSVAPGIPASQQYDVVLGTDILYEWEMAASVAAAVAHRLRPGGRALICNAVRDQAMFDALVGNLRARGLRVGVTAIEPRQEDGGVPPHDQPYEGGYVLVAAEHADAPAADWHRDDMFGA